MQDGAECKKLTDEMKTWWGYYLETDLGKWKFTCCEDMLCSKRQTCCYCGKRFVESVVVALFLGSFNCKFMRKAVTFLGPFWEDMA